MQIRRNGWPSAYLVNLGGGLDIPHVIPDRTDNWPVGPVYDRTPTGTTPTPEVLIDEVRRLLPPGSSLMLEPGRSLVATAGEVRN